VGQYCIARSAKETSRIVSPQTGHCSPARPCTRSPVFFSAFSSLAASPCERAIASPSTSRIAAYSSSVSASLRELHGLYGDSLAACSASSE
jgi:hypothetical protein